MSEAEVELQNGRAAGHEQLVIRLSRELARLGGWSLIVPKRYVAEAERIITEVLGL